MQICRTILDLRACHTQWRAQGDLIAFVPTMGALHQGHLALVARARDWVQSHGGGRVVTSIFVNPLQFDQRTDLDLYPRTEAKDVDLLRDAGCDAVFLPSVAEIYPDTAQTHVNVTRLGNMLMGRLRPGHFRGVATVVTKLFNITQADAAVFGEKDYQQLALIRQMVADLHIPITILSVPTQREASGLAMSSRNQRLTPDDAAAASVIHRALVMGEHTVRQGTSVAQLRALLRHTLLQEPRAKIETIDIRDAVDLTPVTTIRRAVVMLLAVRFGDVLLIDQRVAHP